jgi:hypothetical protein
MSRDCSGGGKRVTRPGIENGGPLKERDRSKVNCESSHNRKLGRAPPNQSDDPGQSIQTEQEGQYTLEHVAFARRLHKMFSLSFS